MLAQQKQLRNGYILSVSHPAESVSVLVRAQQFITSPRGGWLGCSFMMVMFIFSFPRFEEETGWVLSIRK